MTMQRRDVLYSSFDHIVRGSSQECLQEMPIPAGQMANSFVSFQMSFVDASSLYLNSIGNENDGDKNLGISILLDSKMAKTS
ncbi:hypothetical protein QG37_02741 [Candidozyma auris]|nr:hypothetical protein QG37_02741 [[Candida] auris]